MARKKDEMMDRSLTRRDLLRVGTLGTAGLAAGGSFLAIPGLGQSDASQSQDHVTHHDMMTVGKLAPGSFDPNAFLTHFDTGNVSRLPSGQVLREYELVAKTARSRLPPGSSIRRGPTTDKYPAPPFAAPRATGFGFGSSTGQPPHTIHFHGIHPPGMDGAFEPVRRGQSFIYEFDAEPFGLHLYHCHTVPIKRHIHKGLYGAFIIDPKQGAAARP